MKLHTKILLGLVIGAALGVVANLTLGPEHTWVLRLNTYVAGPIGQIFLRLLFMIVMPLVFSSIALGVAGLGDLKKVGRIGGKALGFFLVSTALAAILGLALVDWVRPGSQIAPETRAELVETYVAESAPPAATSFGIHTIVNIVTRNPLKSMVDGDMLGVIFFGLVFGAALTMVPAAKARPIIAVLEGVFEVVIKVVDMAMRIAPYGVAGLIFGLTSEFGFALLAPLSRYVILVLVALLLHAAVTMSLVVRFAVGISPLLFYKRIRASMVTAFSTSSSAATLPTNIVVSEQNLGAPPQLAGFVLPLGSTMCMNGTSLFEGITVIFLCQVFGLTLSVPEMAIVMAMAVITAVGAAGVPGGSIPLLVGILAMFNVPAEGIALILGVDRILDMSRTVVNIIGDHVATLWVGKSEGIWNPSMIPAVEMAGAAPMDESPGFPEGDRR